MKNVLFKYAAIGAGIVTGYTMITDYLRYHDEANARPRYFDHMIATTLLTSVAGGFAFRHPWYILFSAFFSVMVITPTTWWFVRVSKLNKTRNPNIFYQNDVTAEEVERFRN